MYKLSVDHLSNKCQSLEVTQRDFLEKRENVFPAVSSTIANTPPTTTTLFPLPMDSLFQEMNEEARVIAVGYRLPKKELDTFQEKTIFQLSQGL